jgi:hypothetical protein
MNIILITLSEILKLVDIVLTTPTPAVVLEHCFSTLRKVKTYLRNAMGPVLMH